MKTWELRTKALIGNIAFDKLKESSVAVIGLGGVGGACLEGLCRSGIGHLILMDHDTIDITNINRQLIATVDTVGQSKAQAWKERLHQINPQCKITVLNDFYNQETAEAFFSNRPDFVIDAIDTVSSKLHLAEECKKRNIPLIASMGTGNRLDPTQFHIGTIEDTSGCGCGLARVMRRELKKRGIDKLPVLYSTEIPRNVITDQSNGRHSPASISFCPPVGGYILASYVVRRIIEEENSHT